MSDITKMAVLYYSRSGNTREMAERIVQGMERVPGVQARAFSVEETDLDWVRESKCLVVGSPIYAGSIAGDLKLWLEKTFVKCLPAGKIGGAFATAGYVHGGGDLGIRLILDHMMVYGMLTYSGGAAFGKPVIHLGPVAISEHLAEFQETFMTYGERMAKKTVEVLG